MFKFSLDPGGSLIRVCKDRGPIEIFPSEYLLISPSDGIIDSVSDKYSACDITLNGDTYRVVKGESLNYYKAEPNFCDNNVLKANFIGTFLNMAYAIARVSDGCQDVECEVGVCLPPSEVFLNDAKESFINAFAGTITVHFYLLNQTVNIHTIKEGIRVFPEGIISILSIPQEHKTLRKKILSSSCIVFDLGYRSFDSSVLRKGVPYRGAYDSAPIGGINLESMLNSSLEKNGIFLDRDEVRDALCKGRIRKPGKSVPIGPEVKKIKEAFALSIRERATRVLNAAGLNIASVNYFIPVGRPFNQTGIKDSPTDGGCLVDIVSELMQLEAICIPAPETANILGVRERLFAL